MSRHLHKPRQTVYANGRQPQCLHNGRKPIECEIFQGKQLVQNHDQGVVMSTQSLVLQKVDREDLIFALRME